MPEPLISLCMIVGNVEEYIERCLESFLPIADEICIARAIGNLEPDKTIGLASKVIDLYRAPDGFGPKQRTIKWIEYKNKPEHQSWPHLDDFAAARNASFDLATGKWIFWCDSDDVLEYGAEFIREDAKESKYPVYVIPYRIFGRDVNIQRERLILRGSGKWTYPVHECFAFTPEVEGALDERVSVLHLPSIHKTGSNDRNLRILDSIPKEELTPGLKYHLHGELLGTHQLEGAVKVGMEAVACEELGIPERYEIFLNLGKVASDKDLTLQLFHQAYKLDPSRREALGLLTCTALDYGLNKEALAYGRAMMSLPPPEKANWNDRNSAYDWLGVDIYTQALRANKKRGDAEKHRLEVLELAIKSGRPIISLVHATRGRAVQASKARKMWMDLADRPDAVEHIFIYGEDDEASYPLHRMHHQMIPAGLGCVGGWNAGAAVCNGDIIIQLSDDWIPPLQWDTKIIDRLWKATGVESAVSAAKHFPAAVLAVSDGHRKDDLLCMAIMTKAYYQLDWFMFHPRFFGVYSDNWFTREAYRRGAVIDAKDLVFTHDHPYFKDPASPMPATTLDETYQLQNDPKRYEEGKAIYDELLEGRDWSTIPGWFNFWPLYRELAKTLQDGDVAAEIGVYLGRSIIYLAQELKRVGKKVKLLAIDNFAGEPGVKEHAEAIAECDAKGSSLKQEFLKNVDRCGVSDMITLMEGDSVKVARNMPNGTLAFCFIDASHDYESVQRDITAWTPKVKQGRTIAGHDAQWDGVKRAVLQRFPKAYINGPVWMAKTA